jgi:hypothetical protein
MLTASSQRVDKHSVVVCVPACVFEAVRKEDFQYRDVKIKELREELNIKDWSSFVF